MRLRNLIFGALCLGAFGVGTASADVDTHIAAKNLTAEDASVWNAIDRYWGRSGCCGHENLMKDSKYLDYISDDGFGWYLGQTAPVSKASTKMWEEAQSGPTHATRVAYEIYPQGLVIHGNVAVAHYRYQVSATSAHNPKSLNTAQGRYTDVLVRDKPGGEWKYLAWIGGSDSTR